MIYDTPSGIRVVRLDDGEDVTGTEEAVIPVEMLKAAAEDAFDTAAVFNSIGDHYQVTQRPKGKRHLRLVQ